MRRWKKTSNSASLAFVRGTGEFPAQMASSAENISIWWRHHATSSHGHNVYMVPARDLSYNQVYLGYL